MVYLEEVYLSKEGLPELEEEFYKNYDESYWNTKIEMYDYLLENMEDVFKGAAEEDLDDHRRLVKAEFVYMFYHSAEALFGLVRSLTKGGIPWIDLKETYSGDITAFVEKELQSEDFDEELVDVFYPGVRPTEEQKKQIDQSVNLIWRYLKKVGSMYDDRTVYNEYKHGLRLMANQSRIDIEVEDENADQSVFAAFEGVEETDDGLVWSPLNGDVLLYLDPSVWQQNYNSDAKFWSLSRKMQSLEFGLYRRLSSFNADLISQIFSVRRDILDLDVGDRKKSSMKLYHEVDLEEVLKLENPLQEFSVDLYYPRGEEDLLVYEIT